MKNFAGIADRRVKLETEASAASGEPNPVWVELATVWAGKKDERTVAEGPDGKTILATGKTTWTIRYRAGLTPKTRLTDLTTNIIYNVEGVSEIGRREALALTTTRHNA